MVLALNSVRLCVAGVGGRDCIPACLLGAVYSFEWHMAAGGEDGVSGELAVG